MIAVRGCERHELLKYLAPGQAPQKQNYTAAYYSQTIPPMTEPIKYFLWSIYD